MEGPNEELAGIAGKGLEGDEKGRAVNHGRWKGRATCCTRDVKK